MAFQAGRVAPDLCRAPTSVVGCPPGQKRNSDVKGSRHTLLVPLGVPEDDPLHVLPLIWPDQNPAATARLRPHASISNGARPRRRVQITFCGLGVSVGIFLQSKPNKIQKKLGSWSRQYFKVGI